MIHDANCKCSACHGVYSNGDWLVSHDFGDVRVDVLKTSLTPESAFGLSTSIECAAHDALRWRQVQLAAAGLDAQPPTERSRENGTTH